MADETEQMIWQGDVWSGMFVHREYCQYTTGHSPFGSGPIQVISLMKLRNLVWSDQGALIGRDVEDLDTWVTREMMETLELLRVDVATFGIHDLDFGVCHARTLTKDECLFKKKGRQKRTGLQWTMNKMTEVGGQPLTKAEPKAIKDHAGLRVGLLVISMNWLNLDGLSTNMTNPDQLAEWTDEVEMPEVDFFLGGHEHLYLETDRYVKPWVQECLISMPNILPRHGIEVGPAHDTLDKMPSSEAFDLVSGDANKREYKCYVEMLIARGLLDKNAMIVADNKSCCGFPSALSESCLLEETEPKTRSNTKKDRVQSTILSPGVILSCSSLTGPRIQSTSRSKRRIRSVQQSHEQFVGIKYNTEENDDVFEENYMTVYVKTINGKTMSIRYYKNMTAAVILEEVERRTLIPRDMIRLVHKGKAINEKKSMKENNIKAKETIEMSLRLLGGMEANEQMDTHETEEDRDKKKEAGRRKRRKNDETK